jgi:hypothetical protein
MATDITKYTGQFSGLMATERTRSEIILFSFELDLTVLVRLPIEQHWRPLGVSLAFEPFLCDKECSASRRNPSKTSHQNGQKLAS